MSRNTCKLIISFHHFIDLPPLLKIKGNNLKRLHELMTYYVSDDFLQHIFFYIYILKRKILQIENQNELKIMKSN